MSIERVESLFRFKLGRAGLAAFLCLAAAVSSSPRAAAQTPEFTLTPSALNPGAVAPGGVSSIALQVTSQSGFSGTINLTCQVTSSITTTDTPECSMSPASVTVPGVATANITTKGTTTQTLYGVTITGTDPTTSFSATTPAQNFTVLAVTPQFTISVQSPVSPNSVVAGRNAVGVVIVNAANGYTPPKGGITLSCGSITPLETITPVCSFTYPNSSLSNAMSFNGGTAGIGNLTITTFGPITTGARAQRSSYYALWFALPFFGFAGIGVSTANRRSRKAWLLISLFVLASLFLLIPACGSNTSSTTTTPNGTTPANTYTFTIVGVDANGVVSSNVSSTNSGPTVTLTVTAPPKH